jgi:transposase-like protein
MSRARKGLLMSSSNVMAVSSTIPAEVEVVAKATRRRFTAEYKLKVLREADRSRKPGEIGALLRREGLYTSHLSAWRQQRDKGELFEKKRGPAPREKNPLAAKVAALEKETKRLKARAERAEALVELQKKVSEILGIELRRNGEKD